MLLTHPTHVQTSGTKARADFNAAAVAHNAQEKKKVENENN